MRALTSALIAAATLAATAAPCFAEVYGVYTESDTAYYRTQIAGLNLRSHRGANVALDRIVYNATRACDDRPRGDEIGYYQQLHAYQYCVKETTRDAVHAVGAPMVERAFSERFGGVIVDDEY